MTPEAASYEPATAGLFFAEHARDGRAVIFHNSADESSMFTDGPEPRLWLCRVGEQLVAVDSTGPNNDDEVDRGFLVGVQPDAPVALIVARWVKHRTTILDGRLVRRGRPRKHARPYLTYTKPVVS